jgi:hypothetical protein
MYTFKVDRVLVLEHPHKHLHKHLHKHPHTDLIVEQYTDDGHHHADGVGERDGIAQQEQRHGDDSDALGAVGDGVAQRRHQRNDGESNDVLRKVAETVDEQQRDESWSVRAVRLRGTITTKRQSQLRLLQICRRYR